MLRPLCDLSFRDVFLALARHRSPTDELRCRALLDLLETCQVLDRALRRELEASGLTESGFLVLAHLIPHGPGEGGAHTCLAQTLHLSRPALAEVLGRLEISALVTRRRSLGDRGDLAIVATDLGREVFSNALARSVDAFVRAAGTLDDRETAVVELAGIRLREAFASDPSL